jgi:signal transduction histidine kinase
MLSLLTGDTWSPTRIAIIGGWIAVLGGVFAIGWVLRQSVQLGERRGRFVSAVTHELRTPLTTFALYSQMLADGMVQDPEAQREYHQTLRKESDRLSRIVESVLDYARLGKRRSDTNGNVIRPAINAADLIKAVEPHLRSRASVSGLELIVDTPDLSTITLRAERDSVERILENLVENAGKYAAGHGTDQRLHLIAALEGRWLNLDIADHGPGIAPGEARRIFAPFERGKAQQDGSKPGLGLGLAFARGLARDLGGDLILLSPQDSMRAGFGAIFRLRIPAELEVQNAETAADSAAIADPSENSPVDAAPPTESRPQ